MQKINFFCLFGQAIVAYYKDYLRLVISYYPSYQVTYTSIMYEI